MAVDLDADSEALRQWIMAVDEREKLSEIAVAQPLIHGARHTKEHPHLVLNPLFRRITALTDEIRRSQEAFGMTPLSRFRLQITYAEAGHSLTDLRKRAAFESRDRPMILDMEDLG